LPKKEKWIQVRMNDKEKEEWEKYALENNFPSLSQFVRFCVTEFIEKDIKTTVELNSIEQNAKDKEIIREIILEWKEERKEFFQKITDILYYKKRKKW